MPVASFAAGFIITSTGQINDANNVPFMMRGINYPYTWYAWRGDAAVQQDLANIAATGSNVVRVVLSTGGQWARINGPQVTQVIEWCKALKMIAVLEVHDSTGWSEQTTAVPISNATAYWTSSDIRAAINGQENFVIINIANEPFGNTTTANYVADTSAAIRALRTAGLTHTLMIDGATWGQDWQGTMRDNAMTLWNADTLHNTIFSVHMYEVYQSVTPISAYMQAFQNMNLPLIVGEFGPVNNGQFVDSENVIAQAQARRLGYIGWSWSGNGGGGTGLDMTVNFDPAQFTTWGNRIANGTNGIRATSVPATVFPGSGSNLAVSPTTLSFASAASSSPVTVTANVSWTITDNQTWLTTSSASGSNNGSFTVSATANTGTAARTGNVTVTGGGITRTIAVTQAAPAANNLTLSASAWAPAAAASSTAVSVTANVTWTVTDDQSWLSASPASGSNNGSFTLSATANTATTSRTGTVTVTGGGLSRTVAVTQAGTSTTNTLTVSATSLALGSALSSGTFSITSNVSWTVADDQTWITVSPASGSNNATVTVNATANSATTSRTGTVTVAGGGLTRTVSVTQAGQTGGGTGTTCPNPVTFSGNTGNFNTTGAVCYRTNVTINGWGCFNFDGRTVTVGGVARTCGQLPVTRAADGYYYFAVTAGQFPWAGMYTW